MTSPEANSAAVWSWLRQRRSVLAATHVRPDGDAIGSLLGLHRVLQAQGLACTPVVDGELPLAFRPYAPPTLRRSGPLNIADYDAVVCLDCATAPRLALPGNLQVGDLGLPVCNIDHHIDNSRYGDLNYIDSASAATAEIVIDLCRDRDLPVDAGAADLLLIGLMTDTGGFRFPNTTVKSFESAAWLLAQGADHARVVREIYMNDPVGLIRLKGRVFETTRFAYDGRLAYFFLTPELFAECGVDPQDSEDLIDSVRVIRGVEICCRMQQTEDAVRFSLRSRTATYPVIEIAHKLGGGGHVMAAGAELKQATLAEAEKRLLAYVGEVLNG